MMFNSNDSLNHGYSTFAHDIPKIVAIITRFLYRLYMPSWCWSKRDNFTVTPLSLAIIQVLLTTYIKEIVKSYLEAFFSITDL